MTEIDNIFRDRFHAAAGNIGFLHGRHTKLPGALLFRCTAGTAAIEVNTVSYALGPDTLLCLMPGRIVTLGPYDDDFTGQAVCISEEVVTELAHNIGSEFFRANDRLPVMPMNRESIVFWERWWPTFEAAGIMRGNIYEERIATHLLQCMLWAVAGTVYGCVEEPSQATGDRSRELFHRFMRLLAEYCPLRRDVEFYASQLYISTRYLTYICNMEGNGRSAKRIIDENAIVSIKAMLGTTDLSLQQIAYKLNFTDQSNMGRYFRKHAGLSPLAYRKEIRSQQRTRAKNSRPEYILQAIINLFGKILLY